MTTHSIRVTCFWGDMDDLHDIYLIGHYDTATARDADLTRIATLPGNHGDATFEASRLDPAGADHRLTPEQVAPAWLFRQLVNGFATGGHEVVCPECGDDLARAAYPECECGTESARYTVEEASHA